MLIDIDARYSLREKIHAFVHRYRLPELPVRVSQGIYQSTGNAQADCLVSRARVKCDKIPKLVVDGKCVEVQDVVEEFTFLSKQDDEFFVIVWSSGFGPEMLKRYQESGLVVGDVSKARSHTYNFLGKEGVTTLLYNFSVYKMEPLNSWKDSEMCKHLYDSFPKELPEELKQIINDGASS